jgi:hypothetical protein
MTCALIALLCAAQVKPANVGLGRLYVGPRSTSVVKSTRDRPDPDGAGILVCYIAVLWSGIRWIGIVAREEESCDPTCLLVWRSHFGGKGCIR